MLFFILVVVLLKGQVHILILNPNIVSRLSLSDMSLVFHLLFHGCHLLLDQVAEPHTGSPAGQIGRNIALPLLLHVLKHPKGHQVKVLQVHIQVNKEVVQVFKLLIRVQNTRTTQRLDI